MSYTYDKSGNIETVSGKNGLLFRYTYDGLNQLIHEENYQQSKRYSYTYDCGGNITERKTYQLVSGIVSELLSTDTYEYETAWKDQLKSYNGQPITYDYAGNPLQYKGNELEWDGVRKLVKYGNNTFAYDADGIRYQKNNVTYTLDGSNIVKETDGVRTLIYYYGTNGVVGFNYSGNDYYYRKNLQGDVIEIYRADGTLIAGYEYDAWGRILRVIEHNNSGIGAINPFRYRSYYYDVETGLYYLQTRYYDPEIGRFINADSYLGAGAELLNCNLFLYCENNPVINYDPTGTISNPWWELSSWGEIHRAVQEDIVGKFDGAVVTERNYIDIYFVEASGIYEQFSIYEVKPVSRLLFPKPANNQIERYQSNNPGTKLGKKPISGEFNYDGGLFNYRYTVTYGSHPEYPHLILYNFERDLTEAEKEALRQGATATLQGIGITGLNKLIKSSARTGAVVRGGAGAGVGVGAGVGSRGYAGGYGFSGRGFNWNMPLTNVTLI